jgi:hypothetical protein
MLPFHVSKNYNLSFENKQTLVVKRWRPDHIQVTQVVGVVSSGFLGNFEKGSKTQKQRK